MYDLIDRWQLSGMPQKDFCKAEGINYYKFKYWRTIQKKEAINQTPQNNHEPNEQRFIPIEKPKEKISFGGMQINYPNGVSITCSAQTNKEQLSELIKLY